MNRVLELQTIADSHKDWWFFPTEPLVQGFLGTGKLFIVGDQPSNDHWEFEHPHRRAYYDVLAATGAGDSHLTDFYKRRGPAGQFAKGNPNDFPDFDKHLEVFCGEVKLLRPTTILALGWDAYHLLSKHTPELQNIVERIWHFGTVRHGHLAEFQSRLRNAITAARLRDGSN